MDISTINSDLIRGNVTTIILKALADGTSYGYDILKLIEEKTNGKYVIKQPTLYSCLKRLEKQNMIYSHMGNVDDTSGARRRYYMLTDTGKDYLAKMQADYEYSRTILDRLLSDKEFDLTSDNTPFDINELRPYTKVSIDDETVDNVDKNVKVVEKVVYVDKPIEKIVYVDKPVEKVVYVDRIVEKVVPKPVYVNTANGIYTPQNTTNAPALNNENQSFSAPNKLPDAPLINRMQGSLKSGDNINASNDIRQKAAQNRLSNLSDVNRENQLRTRNDAQDRAARILGIGKYRQSNNSKTNGEDDSPNGLKR